MHTVPPFLVSRNIRPWRAVAQNPFRSMKRISDHSRARFTANPELAFQARYGICGRAASLRMLSKNSLMFAPGIWATRRLDLTPPFHFLSPDCSYVQTIWHNANPSQSLLWDRTGTASISCYRLISFGSFSVRNSHYIPAVLILDSR